MNAGGMAGAIAWIIETPQDMIKTRQQAHTGSKPLSMAATAKLILADGGINQTLKAFPIILTRGYLVSFVALPLYEWIKMTHE